LAKVFLIALVVLCGCRAPEQIPGPLGLPPLTVPRKPSPELVAVGKKLFFDPMLSVDGKISCASCHNPDTGFADARKVSLGVADRAGKRNAPTVLNAAYWKRQFWDGRAGSLEEQAAGPISNELEMNHKPEALLARLNADSSYKQAFGGGTIRMNQVLEAIAAYERTLLSGNSPADRYMYGGDKSALSDSAILGLKIFGRHCVNCHSINNNHGLYTDQLFHNVGVGVNSEGELTDLGRGRGEFRTPSLRNVARTAPYMHDGSLKTLREVVDFYIGGGNSNQYLDPLIRPLDLSNEDRDGLIAFLEALNGELPK